MIHPRHPCEWYHSQYTLVRASPTNHCWTTKLPATWGSQLEFLRRRRFPTDGETADANETRVPWYDCSEISSPNPCGFMCPSQPVPIQGDPSWKSSTWIALLRLWATLIVPSLSYSADLWKNFWTEIDQMWCFQTTDFCCFCWQTRWQKQVC